MILSVLLLCSYVSVSGPQEPEGLPPVFASLSFEEAVASTKGNEKVLVVKATADWCQPCKMMDRTTWRDEKVVSWFKENGLAIQFDVDKQKDLAKEQEVRAMPTMIAFVNGEEFDRIVGYKDASELLTWVGGVKEGKRAIEAVRTRVDRAGAGTKEEVDSRYDLAKSLVRTGELDRATEEFAWLWVNSKDVSGYGGVRGSFMAGEIEELAAQHPPALERFKAFRDETGVEIAKEKVDPEALDDWIVLNQVVQEPGRTLEWFDRVKDDPRWLPLIQRSSFRIEVLLERKNRWTDIALMYPDPMGKLRRDHEMLKMSLGISLPENMEERRQEMEEMEWRMFRDDVAKLYAVLLAADREAEAQTFLAEAIKLDDSAEMRLRLVSQAIRVEQPRESHGELLDQAEAGDPGAVQAMKRRLTRALSSSDE